MTDTANLRLPCIEGSQAQKHVTHNEALRILDTLVQLAVLDRDLTAPPELTYEGDRYIVNAEATGAWAECEGAIMAWQDGAWHISVPRVGWLAYVMDEGALLAWDGLEWVDAIAALTSLNNMTRLGVGTMADDTNPFSAKLNNMLFAARTVAEGGDGDLRTKLSKESAADTASLLFQSGYSGRAELGLTGDDNFHVKVSADGSAWTEAMTIDRTTGGVSFPNSAWAPTGGSFANKFRNAALNIWQRGTGGTVTAGTPAYTADGWIAGCTGADIAWSRQAGRLFSPYSLRLTGATSVTDIFVRQRIESFWCSPLAGLPVTVQGRVYNNTGGSITPTITVKRAGAADDWASSNTDVNAVSLQPCADSAWTQISYTFMANAGAGAGLEVTIDFGNNFSAGTKYVQICEMDIGIGNLLRPPEFADSALEVLRAKRYLQIFRRDGSNIFIGFGMASAATTGFVGPAGYLPMRTKPALTYSELADFTVYLATVTPTALSLNAFSTADGVLIDVIVSGGLTASNGITLSVTADGYLALSAEL